MTRSPFVSFWSLIFVRYPVTELDSALLHGSPPGLLAAAVGRDVNVGMTRGASRVGNGIGVSVGSGVGTGVSVDGTGVLVGMAACVSATMVKAADTAVDCISCALMTGSAGVLPHALITIAMVMTSEIEKKRFISINILLYYINTLDSNWLTR